MRTTLSGRDKQAVIDTLGAVAVIGEKINPTGRKKLAEALMESDFDYVLELARRQVAGMADILDVNVGVPGVDDHHGHTRPEPGAALQPPPANRRRRVHPA